MRMLQYVIVIVPGPGGCSAYVPDLPGCVASAETEEGVRGAIANAVEAHLKALREGGQPIPEPTSIGLYVQISDPAVDPEQNGPA